ncbi:MAG: hypothetical protein ACLVB4_10565 [Butyricicoccus sp.]
MPCSSAVWNCLRSAAVHEKCARQRPRDALMVALARKFGRSAGACRAVVDVLVTVIGFFLGGPVGVGTIISAVGLGPLINLNFAAVRFNPAEVHQENAAETIARIAGKR